MTLSPIARAKQRIFEDMRPKLQLVAKELDESAYKTAKGVLKIAYSAGKDLQTVRDDPAQFGVKGIQQLADYRGQSPQTLYLKIRLVETWTLDEVEELCLRYSETGKQITQSHLYVLCEVESTERRNELLEEFFSSPMSVRDLRGAVRREKKKQKLGVGRKPARPTSIPAGAQEISKQTQRLSNYLRNQGEDLFHQIENCPPEELTENVESDFQRLGEVLTNLIPQLKNIRKKMVKAQQHFEQQPASP